MYCRSRKVLNGPEKKVGTHRGCSVLIHPNQLKSTYCGMSVMWLGSMSVLRSKRKRTPRPRNRSLAKANATIELEMTIPMTLSTDTIMVLR